MMRFTLEDLEQADADGDGFCVECGNCQSGVEPDAREYECESCSAMKVYGAAELIIMGLVE